MASLKNRQSQIPNGLKFALPEVGYTSAPYASFDTILNTVDNVIRANPGVARAAGWPTDRKEIAEWIDDFNARICIANGWMDYVSAGAEDSPPKHGPPPGRHAGVVAAGARAIAQWVGDGATPVDHETATARAGTCVKCPLNQPGDLTNFFERATSEMLRKQISAFRDDKLFTQHDQKLGVCQACYCPMKLKVHFPLDYIVNNITKESKDALHQDCWIISKSKTAEAKGPAGGVEEKQPGGTATGATPAIPKAQGAVPGTQEKILP